jgi:hypothetical protein
MEHVADWDEAFANFSLLLNHEAMLVLTVPHFFYLHEEPYDFWRPTKHAFEYFGNRYNLRIDKFKKGGSTLDVLETIWSGEKTYPRKMKLIDRFIAFLIRKGIRLSKTQLIQNLTENRIDFSPSYYLSNQVVMVKK